MVSRLEHSVSRLYFRRQEGDYLSLIRKKTSVTGTDDFLRSLSGGRINRSPPLFAFAAEGVDKGRQNLGEFTAYKGKVSIKLRNRIITYGGVFIDNGI